LEEARKIEESVIRELEESNRARENLEANIVSLRKEVQKGNVQQNFANSSKALDALIRSQRPCNDKTRLGYRETIVKGKSSSKTKKVDGQKTYAKIAKGSIKKKGPEGSRDTKSIRRLLENSTTKKVSPSQVPNHLSWCMLFLWKFWT